ncbi:hypothetical protein NKH18_27210 [Streptomyces sp. M10(2022)]
MTVPAYVRPDTGVHHPARKNKLNVAFSWAVHRSWSARSRPTPVCALTITRRSGSAASSGS